MTDLEDDLPAFLSGEGELRRLMRKLDWSSSPLGNPHDWPPLLQSFASLVLDAQQAMFVAWGPKLAFIYNDAYAPILGAKHSSALGRPFSEVWTDIWEQIHPLVTRTLAGEASWNEDLLIPMRRHGYLEEAWFSFSYNPIRNETGTVVGMLCAATETTGKILTERRNTSERERLRQMFEQAPGFMAMLGEPNHIFELANPAYLDLIGRTDVLGRPAREVLPEVEGQGYFELLDKVFVSGEPFKAQGMKLSVQSTPGGIPHDRYVDFVYQPLKAADGKTVGIFIEGYDVTETKLAQNALERNQETLRIALSAARLGTWERDLATGEITASETCRASFGLAADDAFTFDLLASRIHPDDRDSVLRHINEAIANGLEYDVEYRCVWLDNSVHWILARGHAIYGDKGQPTRMVGVTLDVTDRRASEEALREETFALEVLNNTAAEVAGELHLDRLVQTVVDAGVELSGAQFGAFFYTVSDPSGEAFTLYALSGAPREAFSGYPHPRATEVFAPTFKGEGIVRSDDITKDPRYGRNNPNRGMPEGHLPVRSYLAVPVKSRTGEVIGGLFFGHAEVGVFNERTERVMIGLAAQAAIGVDNARLFQSLQHLNETLEVQVAERTADRDRMWRLSTDIMLVARYDGTITGVNPAWAKVLGWRDNELLGRRFTDFVHPDDVDRTLEEAERNASGAVTQRLENRYRTRGGDYRWISWVTVPEAGFLHAVGRDVTVEKEATEALRQTEEALRQAQKMEAVGQLTGGLAHDFNNILAGISGSLEIMSNRLAQGRVSDLDRYITGASGAAKRAAGLTQRLLAFSRRQTLEPKPTNLNNLIDGMLELINRSVGPEIEVEAAGATGLWTVFVDAGQLENALLNLCINARDAMPGGGKLTIESANRWMDDRAAKQNNMAPGQYVSLCVSDTGTGMPSEVIERAFDPFFTTKPIGEGTGLGLSMVYGFAGQSGGAVRIYSEVGKGTMVCIYLPRHIGDAEAEEAVAGATELPRPNDSETVLLVDDEPLVRMIAAEALEELGYTVIEAIDGPSALKILHSPERISLLITDVGLPGGMNGRQVADAARVTRPDLKVLFVTGYAENAVLNHGHLSPGMQVLTKPFQMDSFARRVKDMIEE